MSWIEREQRHTSGVYPKRELILARGAGSRVWDAEGREFLDFTSGQGVANVGHCHPAVVAALSEQAAQLITCPEIFFNEQRARLAWSGWRGCFPQGWSGSSFATRGRRRWKRRSSLRG